MGKPLRSTARRFFGALGLEVHRKSVLPPVNDDRRTLRGVLSHAASLGFAPATVIDVGAAEGSFTKECLHVFPQASYVLVEPLQEFAPALARLQASMPGMTVRHAAAASRAGSVTLHVHSDLDGSSLLLEAEGGAVNGTPRAVEAITLDGLVAAYGLAGPFLLKLDVQGAELDVLEGASRTLSASDLVLAEVSFYQAFENGPQFADVVNYMKARDFVAYDLCGFLYRPLDGALAQADAAFVKEGGIFRRSRAFATAGQRAELDRRFAAAHAASTGSGDPR